MLQFRAFEIVEAIMRSGSLSSASARLHMSQPALTKALSGIEAKLGQKLFIRGAIGVEPTFAARVVMRHWPDINRDLVDMRREIDRIRGVDGGVLRIATGYLAATSAEIALGSLIKRFPSLRIETRQLVWSDVAAAVHSAAVDIGIADPTEAEGDPSIAIEYLSQRQAFFICRKSHPLLALEKPSLKDILSYPLAINLIPAHIAAYFSDAGLNSDQYQTVNGHLRSPIVVQSISAIRHVLTNSDAVSIMPDNMMAEPFMSGTLAKIDRLRADWLTVRLAFMRRQNSTLTPAMAALIEEVRRIELG